MLSHECGTLHEDPLRRGECRECGTPVCPVCALQIEGDSVCRWCRTCPWLAHAA